MNIFNFAQIQQNMLKPEIERKFLVKGNFEPFATKKIKIVQGYLSSVPERSVRIRISDDVAFLTIKGKSDEKGLSRLEWEKQIDREEAEKLLTLSEPYLIEKSRYIIPINDNLFFEVDVFSGGNEGLIIAEIELPDEHTFFEKPEWLGKEVTGQKQYYNVNLLKNPFTLWK